MTHPTDAAIAQAFREVVAKGYNEIFPCEIEDRARELDGAKGGEVADHEYQRGVCVHCGMEAWMGGECSSPREATPPAQAAEAVERVAMALLIQQTGDPSQGADEQWRSVMTGTRQTYIALARAAIAAMQAGE